MVREGEAMSDQFAQEPAPQPMALHLPTKGCHFPYEVFEANGFTMEWVFPDALWQLLQDNALYWKDGRCYVCGDDVPTYTSGITKLPETIAARDVTDIVAEFRKKVPA